MWHGASNGESHRWEDRRGQCREHSVWGKMQMKLRYRGAGCGDLGGTGDGAVSRGRDRVVVHGGQMMGHRWWAQIVQEGVVMGGAHRVRYGGFRMWHGASDGEAQVGVRGVQVGTVQREHSVVGEEADEAAIQRVQDVVRGARG